MSGHAPSSNRTNGHGEARERSDPRGVAEEVLVRFLARHGLDEEAFEELARASEPPLRPILRDLFANVRATAECFDHLTPGLVDTTWPERPALDSDGPELWGRLADGDPRRARYEVRGAIAEGGMGHVLEVWDRDLRRTLAMKCVGHQDEAPPARSGRLVARFLEEAQITGQLQHPGIVPVHELGLDRDGRAYFTMPHVGSCEFREVIDLARAERDGWSLARALNVLVKVCEAVAFAHSKNVVHRDLKPSNVMVGRFGETYVMDWGLARVLDRPDPDDARERTEPDSTRRVTTERTAGETPGSPLVTVDGDVIGTPAYMAPEQARGKVEDLDVRADVYSLGAMLYHLLAGHPPYGGRGARTTPHALLCAVRDGPPPAVQDVAPAAPVDLAHVCAKAMARRPEERYASALELARDLEAYLGARPVSVHESTPAYLLRLALRRNRALSLTVGAALAVALTWGALDLIHVHRAWKKEQGLVADANAAREATQRLSDRSVAELLRTRAADLHAGLPNALASLTAWLDDADDVLGRREGYRDAAARAPDAEALADLVSELERLAAVRAIVAERADQARRLPELTLVESADRWREATDAIRASERYAGLELEPQLGLVPLREDPDSGLWEFWVPLSGRRPFPSARGGWLLEPDTGLVLVLSPGGTWRPAGAPGRDEPVDVEPFFIGKYEVTQGQWERVMGTSPSSAHLINGLTLDEPDRHPVEGVSWFEAMEFGRRVGCSLPTEYQWEVAGRGGARSSAFWWGDTFEGVQLRENLADRSASSDLVLAFGDWDDGHAIHAPVGSFRPNDQGLYDVAGNVAEWCRNPWPGPDDRRRAFRGGSWYHPPQFAAAAQWQADQPRGLNMARGLRVARAIDPARSAPVRTAARR